MHFLPLFLFLCLTHTVLTGGRVLVSLYALSLGAGATTVGLVVGLFAFVPMLAGIKLGRLLDRVGLFPVLLWGAVALATGAALPFVLPGLPTLVPAGILIGTGHLMCQVAGQHAVGLSSTDANRASHFGHLASAYSIASFAGPMSVGFAIEAFGHRATFALMLGVMACALALLASRTLHLPDHQPPPAHKPAGSPLELLVDPRIRAILTVAILQSSAWDIYVFVVPLLGTRLGFTPSTIGMILAAFALATLVIRVLMPWLRRHLREWQVLRIALAFAAVGYLLLPFIDRPWMYFAMSVLFGLNLGAGQPNLLALLHLAAPPGRGGEALGLRATIANANQLLLPLSFGPASGLIGMKALFWTFATMLGYGVHVSTREGKKQR